MSHLVRLAQYLYWSTIHLLKLIARWLGNTFLRKRVPGYALLGDEITWLFEDLGPTFVKVGQILSSRPDLIRPEVAASLARLQDQMRQVPAHAIEKILAQAYGTDLTSTFATFDFRAIAAASIAQVHHARLRNGYEVAVKIQRPGIRLIVERDLSLLKAFARTVERLPFMKVIPMADLVREVAEPIYEQLNFEIEASNNRRLRREFAAVERIHIPALVDHLCRPQILVMEFLHGLQRINNNRLNQQQRQVTALAGLRALYRMIFRHGFVHADMHPGNVFLRNEGELVILDTGLVARLQDSDREDFTNFFFALVNNDGKECARIVHDNAAYFSPRYSRTSFEEEMTRLIARHSRLKSNEFEVSTFVYQLIGLQRAAGVRGSTKFIMTILSMVVFDGICKQLYPECEFQKEAKPFLIASRYGGRPRLALTV